MKLKDLKKDDLFTLKPISEPKESQVFIRGDYDRSLKRFICNPYDDFCKDRFFKGDTEVYVDFIFQFFKGLV